MSNKRRAHKRPSAPHATIKPGVYILEIQHDDVCPTLRTRRSDDCTCAKVNQVIKRYNEREGVR